MNSYPNDKALPIVNGGASTTASGTPEFDDLDDEMLAVWLADNVLTKNENARRIISSLRSVSKLKERLNRRHSGCACSFDEDDEIVSWCWVHAEYKKALQKIVSLDNDAHPGLSTWHDMRVQAHKEAETLLRPVDRTAPETSTRSADE